MLFSTISWSIDIEIPTCAAKSKGQFYFSDFCKFCFDISCVLDLHMNLVVAIVYCLIAQNKECILPVATLM